MGMLLVRILEGVGNYDLVLDAIYRKFCSVGEDLGGTSFLLLGVEDGDGGADRVIWMEYIPAAVDVMGECFANMDLKTGTEPPPYILRLPCC